MIGSRFAMALLSGVATNGAASPFIAREFPSKPVRLVVSHALGALAGQVQTVFCGESTALGNPGKFRVLAVAGEKRRAPFLDVPTFAEPCHRRIPGLYVPLNAALGRPRALIDRLYDAAGRALRSSERGSRVSRLSLQVVEDSREGVGRRVPGAAKLFAGIAKKAGMQPG